MSGARNWSGSAASSAARGSRSTPRLHLPSTGWLKPVSRDEFFAFALCYSCATDDSEDFHERFLAAIGSKGTHDIAAGDGLKRRSRTSWVKRERRHPHLCGMAASAVSLDSCGARFALRRLPGKGRFSSASCRPFLPGGRVGNGRHRTRFRRPACVADCANSPKPRDPQRRAEAHAAGPTGRACFSRPICCDFPPFGSSTRAAG